MSTFFLSLKDPKDKPQGVLKITFTVWPSGDVTQGWDWIGGPRGSDGGTWTWKDGQSEPITGTIKMELASNRTGEERGKIIAHLFEQDWDKGPTPPNQPWFSRPGTDKFFRYSASPDGIIYIFFWELKK